MSLESFPPLMLSGLRNLFAGIGLCSSSLHVAIRSGRLSPRCVTQRRSERYSWVYRA
ncbi:MAG: Permease of the drug/metabolite transporter (DMT) superfamily [Candidatus Burkholderia crenata]|nr:MAG: Permease of the drug/metabolite transporter (DMT) superfamily [Candidatus Burkholderia crenata]